MQVLLSQSLILGFHLERRKWDSVTMFVNPPALREELTSKSVERFAQTVQGVGFLWNQLKGSFSSQALQPFISRPRAS